jgi:hypothetical protein
MNRNLKIFKIMMTKIPSISPQNLSERKEPTRMIKNSNFLIKNGENGDFHSKNIVPSLPTLSKMT